jgi:Tfp pilus assembly protein PilX
MKKRNKNKIQTNGGAAMMIVVLFFMFISLTILIGMVTPVVREFRIASDNFSSKKAYFLAESGSEDAYYRIRNGKQIGTSESLSIGSDTTTTTITTIGNNQKQIDSVGSSNNDQRKSTLMLSTGAGIAFNYGIQSGNGGFNMSGGSSIIGNVYSNGSIVADSGVSISGSAVAADGVAPVADQSNEIPVVPTSSITFRKVVASQDFAQSFKISKSTSVNMIQFYIKKVGAPPDATISLVTDNNGSPSTTNIAIGTVTLSSGLVTTNYGWIPVVFGSYPILSPNTTYWIVIDNSTQNANNYYIVGANNSYANGTAKTGAYSGSWSVTNLDAYFRVYTGGVTSYIGGGTWAGSVKIGTGTIGDAWATKVQGANVAGNLYCSTGSFNNKSCDTSKGSPPLQPLPFSDANFDAWKAEAVAGGTFNGNYHIGAGGSLGPKKIVGNLTIDGSGTTLLTGTVWVTGIFTLGGGAVINLPANYLKNSGTIITDGTITLGGGTSIASGTKGSYIFVVSTSQCPSGTNCGGNSAITVTGGGGAIAVSAQNGNVLLNGGTKINAAVGNSVTMSGGPSVTYDQGLASPSFKSGPSGGWNLDSWKETP